MTRSPDERPDVSWLALPARDGEPIDHRPSPDEGWIVSWHPAGPEPKGIPHGAAGICVTAEGAIVLVSQDGEHWDLPGGRPNGDEAPEETLRREVWEEACATKTRARLLGFCRGACTSGPQTGGIIVRSVWRAHVELGPWAPRHETSHRRAVPVSEVLGHLTISDGLARIVSRALVEAGMSG